MLRLFRTYFRQSWSNKVFLLYTLLLLGSVRFVLLTVPFRKIAPLIGTHMAESTCKDMSELSYVHRVGWAIGLMSRYTPWESKCLVQAVTGKILLRRRGLPNTLYLGVAKDKEKTMIAHAWLRFGNFAVTGGDGEKKYTIVGMFADNFDEC